MRSGPATPYRPKPEALQLHINNVNGDHDHLKEWLRPLHGVAAEYFEPERVDFQTPTTDGRITGVTAGFPLWRARWTLGRAISQATSEQWRAFVARCRGAQIPFYAADRGRPWPLSAPNGFAGLNRAGGGAFDGTATAWSVNAERDQPSLTNLPAGFVLSIGDYVMWRWITSSEPRRSLHRLVEASTASGAGAVTMRVEPPLPTLIPAGAIADLANPVCIMKLDTTETRLGEKSRSLRIDGQVAGVQDLRA